MTKAEFEIIFNVLDGPTKQVSGIMSSITLNSCICVQKYDALAKQKKSEALAKK